MTGWSCNESFLFGVEDETNLHLGWSFNTDPVLGSVIAGMGVLDDWRVRMEVPVLGQDRRK